MLFLQKIPKLLRWIFSVVILFLIVMTIGRFIFWGAYNPPGKAFSGSSFILGLRFDARVASIIGLFILLLSAVPWFNPFKNFGAVKFWNFILPLAFVILVLFYFIDFYHYDYLHQRLNASVLNYLQDAGISYKMVWQTYPLIKVAIVIIVIAIVAKIIFFTLLNKFLKQDSFYKRKGILTYIISFFILAQIIVGKIVLSPGQFPLRWSDAFTLTDDFKSNLALNPFQSFFSTLSFRKSSFDINKVKALYPTMVAQLGIINSDTTNLNYQRNFAASDSSYNKPNIVLIICESFSAYKSSMYSNPLNTTPYFAELCKSGVFFDRCFTPSYGTARGVWATITGIPDVENPSTASRNPSAVNQNTIINSFKDYNHFYFLGGNANWANIRGLLTNNIANLKLYEEQDYSAKKIDVWGISDKNLFLESNKILKQQTKPFFAIIQTADNHRPYTIPTEDKAAFKMVDYPIDTLKKYGFETIEELNAFRFTDYCYQQFIEAAKKEKYFNNTIFIFVGDHGIRSNEPINFLPKAYGDLGLTCEHVPLLFYSPKLLQAKKIHDVCSQVDILPSAASLANISYSNTTFGRNLFSNTTSTSDNKLAFIIDPDVKSIGIINNNYYFLKNQKTGTQNFVSINDNITVQKNAYTDSIKNYLSNITDGYYETAKYLILNNKKK